MDDAGLVFHEIPEKVCPVCEADVSNIAKFCAHCGHSLVVAEPPKNYKKHVVPVLAFYFISMLVMIIYSLASTSSDTVTSIFVLDMIVASITMFFAFRDHQQMQGLFSIKELKALPLLLLLVILIMAAVVVHYIANFLNANIYEQYYFSTYLYDGMSYPIVLAIISFCFFPAIFEEIAFRGFMFNHLKHIGSVKTTIILTSFLFGVAHLSPISLAWLIPLGLIFAVYRAKYNTLWYGIIGHFTYNATVILIEYWERGWFTTTL